MSSFHFKGSISASKSILNRLLVIRSYAPDLVIEGNSKADDVMKMKSALAHLEKGEPADCGSAGTTLRFLALRASRMPGTHHLAGTLRLFERPQTETARILEQLGCEVQFGPQRLTIRSKGWQPRSNMVVVDRSVSSQFASAVFLNAWNLEHDLSVRFSGDQVSESYLQMTLALVNLVGLDVRKIDNETYLIPAGRQPRAMAISAELDVSSAFAVAALAIAGRGEAVFENWPDQSLQADATFPQILAKLGCDIDRSERNLCVALKPESVLRPIDWDLGTSPDLFPVLAVLCGFAEGRSRLYGAPHLVHKESSRIEKSAELLRMMGRKTRNIPGGLEIDGSAQALSRGDVRKYDTDHDHRLAMAAAVARSAGLNVEIADPQVVTKSFPEFWTILEQGVAN
jgi:3-phosphoshikimate 1-carboxyvinyltransferase